MYNKFVCAGRIGNDPTIKYTQGGIPVVNISVACSEKYKDLQGELQERTEWVKVVIFGKTAEFCGNYLSKGRLVLVEGSLQTRKWQDKTGNDRYITEVKAQRVQALDSKKTEGGGSGPGFADDPGAGDDAPF